MENEIKDVPQFNSDAVDAKRRSSAVLGFGALIAGVVALGLTILPGFVLDQSPPPLPDPPRRIAEAEFDPQMEVAAEEDEGLLVKFKNFTISLRKGDEKQPEDEVEADGEDQAENEVQDAEPAIAPPVAKPANEVADPWPQRFAIASASFALLGLLLGPIAWARERHPALAGWAMAICCVALVWHYIVAGIVVGVIIVVVLMMLASLGS